MTTSFYNGISGLKSFQTGIDVWGDNIANVNTPAFKKSVPEFETLFSNTISDSPVVSDVGLGSSRMSTAKDMSVGSIVNTDNPFDIALGGEGWLAVKKNDKVFYTRNGAFTKDALGNLTNDEGAYLLVASADNIINNNGENVIDTTVDTSSLLNKEVAPISLPENLIYPATATTEMTLDANLKDFKALPALSEKAKPDTDFTALYDNGGNYLNIKNGDSFIYSAGEDTEYSDGFLRRELCLGDDVKDGKDGNISFNINGVDISVDIPDGSTKEEIIDKIDEYLSTEEMQNTLSQNGIGYKTKEGGIEFYSSGKLIITSKDGLIKNSAAVTFTYNKPKSGEYDFNNLNDLKDGIQKVLDSVYPGKSEVEVNDGKIIINNTGEDILKEKTFYNENTNMSLYANLGSIISDIPSGKTASTGDFYVNKRSFGGYIYEKDGSKDQIIMNFTKKEVKDGEVVWNADIEVEKDSKTIFTTSQDLIFNYDGELVGPKTINITNPQKMVLNLKLTSYAKINSNDSFTQNGTPKGDLINYQILEDGKIIADFTNSKSATLAQIPVYHFQNDQGLESLGGSLFVPTDNSNIAFLYKDKDGKLFNNTKIISNAIEQSNVDLSTAMTELIVTQKAFSAAAKTVTTSDQMIQKAIDMKRG